ncbi:helix-turn-helix domain-containing protein [Herbaspirillum seropedicae]|uniref:helix-turn-helix domain-containing protein n=1 Tax=Herbaspirillum seropedicae TaxID=964 RepID=UPI003F8D87B3
MPVFAKRLKDARLRAGLSQERLGIDAGLDEMSASTRMNRYEQGKRVPNPVLVERFAEVLQVPACYFYAVDDKEAELLLSFHQLNGKRKLEAIELIKSLAQPH